MKPVKFSDVAHLYIGCEVQWVNIFDIILRQKLDGQLLDKFNNAKPILRPLSDITEAEATEYFGFKKAIEWHEMKFEDWKKRLLELYKNNDLEISPIEFLHFTKLSFDLFCLIENGEAIDKTKM